jgi:hypothetical protein
MNHDNELSPLEQRARALLRDSAHSLDGATRSRIAQARSAAIAQRDARPGWFSFRYLAPAAGVVATAVLVTVLITGSQDISGVNDPVGSALYDLELLADADAFELSQETDLEFIEWAASMGEQGQAGT